MHFPEQNSIIFIPFFVPGDSGFDIWRRTDISRVKTGGGGGS